MAGATHHATLGLPSALTITLCGGSNGTHVAAAYLGSKPGLSINVLTRRPAEWSRHLTLRTAETSWEGKGEIHGYLQTITDNPAEVIPVSDLVLICAPANIHPILLNKVAPHLRRGAILGCLYCQGGFDWAVRSAISDLSVLDGFFGLQNIPWVCKATEYGKKAQLYGPKKRLVLASFPPEHASHYAIMTSLLFDMPTTTVPNFLSLTLSPSNQIIHPARYYAMFHNWDGTTVYPESSIQWGLYGEFDDDSTTWLGRLDEELQAIKRGLSKKFPDLDLSAVLPIADRILLQYGNDVADKTNLKTIFRTNIGYAGCRTPMQKAESNGQQGVIPALNSRLFWEDIPYGLCVLKSLAQMLDILTPSMDQMILWHQKFMKKEFLVPETKRLNLAIIHETGAPEAYGIEDLESLVANSLKRA